MVGVVEFAFEAVQDVVDAGEAGGLQRVAGIDRAVARAADDHDGAVMHVAGELPHLADEMRIDVPVGTVVPGDMKRAGGMAEQSGESAVDDELSDAAASLLFG